MLRAPANARTGGGLASLGQSKYGLGGRLVVLYWPPDSDQGGPFSRVRSLLVARGLSRASQWEETLSSVWQAGSVRLREERAVTHIMEHESGAIFWEALASAGPMRALARQLTPDLLESLRVEFLASFPAGPVRHPATARLLVAEK